MENKKKASKSITQICTEWTKNKLSNPAKPINPITNYSIKKFSAKYNELEKLCANVKTDEIKKEDIKIVKRKSVLSKPLTAELCELWMKNKYKNPISNYNINESSRIYKEFNEECPVILAAAKKTVQPKKDKIIPKIKDIKIPKINIINDEQEEDRSNDKVYYPSIEDPEFRSKLMALKEINMHKIYDYEDILTTADF
jgi:hypothetical protein